VIEISLLVGKKKVSRGRGRTLRKGGEVLVQKIAIKVDEFLSRGGEVGSSTTPRRRWVGRKRVCSSGPLLGTSEKPKLERELDVEAIKKCHDLKGKKPGR